jgi:XTP/dITP diphosphohydrolase
MRILIATKNEGKVDEFRSMFNKSDIEVVSLMDIGELPDVEETGTTFEENAILKAETICSIVNIPVISDDSGLEIDALDGRPGVFSARYAGTHKSDEENMQKVLEEMKEIPGAIRSARFICALALARPGKGTIVVEGVCEGEILEEKRGDKGFGYDPIFYLPHLNRSMAQLTKDEKNQISHRSQAMAKLKQYIRQEDMVWEKPLL